MKINSEITLNLTAKELKDLVEMATTTTNYWRIKGLEKEGTEKETCLSIADEYANYVDKFRTAYNGIEND